MIADYVPTMFRRKDPPIPSIDSTIQAGDFVKSLPKDFKQALLVELVKEALAANRGKRHIQLPIQTNEYCVVSLQPFLLPEHTAEDEARIALAVATPDKTFDPEEFFDQLSREDRD
jgi:hypothetical protein